jgi:hypothetical protein
MGDSLDILIEATKEILHIIASNRQNASVIDPEQVVYYELALPLKTTDHFNLLTPVTTCTPEAQWESTQLGVFCKGTANEEKLLEVWHIQMNSYVFVLH